jgi:hypothetical protein
MRELLQYTARNAYATTLLLFPEGTDLSASNVEKSRKFAESKGITPTHYVLQVRQCSLVVMRCNSNLIAVVVDITAYSIQLLLVARS